MSETKLPWSEKVAMLSINPDAASSADVAQLASELMNCHRQDSVKTNEINVLVKENNELRAANEEKIDILMKWMAERLNILINQQPTPVTWAGDRRLGKIAELEFVIRTANDIWGCIYPGEPCCGRPKSECQCTRT